MNRLDSGIHEPRYWDQRYREAGSQFVFGRQPDDLARMLYGFHVDLGLPTDTDLLDLGCGEGRDAVYFAEKGFRVTAVDSSAEGLDKGRRLAAGRGVGVSFSHVPVEEFKLDRTWPVIYANNVIQFLGRAAVDYLRNLQRNIQPEGWLAVSVFTDECLAPEDHPELYIARRNELTAYFEGWKIFYYGENRLFRTQRGHYLSFAKIIARKPA